MMFSAKLRKELMTQAHYFPFVYDVPNGIEKRHYISAPNEINHNFDDSWQPMVHLRWPLGFEYGV